MWKEALQLSMAESSQASLERNHGDIYSSSSLHEVDIKAAARACRNSEIPRRYASSPFLLAAGAEAHQQTLPGDGALHCGWSCIGILGWRGGGVMHWGWGEGEMVMHWGQGGGGFLRADILSSCSPLGTLTSLRACMTLTL